MRFVVLTSSFLVANVVETGATAPYMRNESSVDLVSKPIDAMIIQHSSSPGSAVVSEAPEPIPTKKVTIPHLGFEEMLYPKGGYVKQEIGKTQNYYSIFISHNPHTISGVNATFLPGRDDCQEQLAGFIPETFRDSRIVALLDEVEYVPCSSSTGVSVSKQSFDITPELTELGEDLILNCRFKDHKTGRLFAGRRTAKGKWAKNIAARIVYIRFRNRVHYKNLESQLRECAEILQNIVKIDRHLIKERFDSNMFELDDIMPDELVIEVQPSEEPPSSSLSAGYIILIVIGSLSILVGSYYAYAQFSSKRSKKQNSLLRNESN